MATPHNKALKGEIARTVIMPGDPLRAKFIADTFLEDVKMFNDVRNMFGFTGTYKGKKVSVMGSGMGIPSISLYAYELYEFYEVENIIRVGSAGAYAEDLDIFDTVLVTGSFSESSFAKAYGNYDGKIMYPDEDLNDKLRDSAQNSGIDLHEGLICSSDPFYYVNGMDEHSLENARTYNLLAVEMESFGLFTVAKSLNKKAACLLTISDHLINHKETSAQERQTRLLDMIKIALDADIYGE
ncbi:MAG: purine-nucleoside phosphorylase [Erysipelotrichaceae bacterium]|nr:purine-nucleoside phosphorylase [Erysipelotrichaceae bacterium]